MGGGDVDPTEEYFDKGQWGWDGTRWRKLNLTWGYYDRLIEIKQNLAAAAGTNVLAHTPVPAGEVWCVTGNSVMDTPTAAQAVIRLWDGAAEITFYGFGALTPGIWKTFSPAQIICKAGDFIEVYFTGCDLNDQIFSTIWGYKMKVT